jgi:sRNA-binding carbon storage regulator CsrA
VLLFLAGQAVRITVARLSDTQAWLGIDAPPAIQVLREEVARRRAA